MRTIVILGSILLNAVLVVIGRGSFAHVISVIMLIVYIAVPTTLVALVCLLAARRYQSPTARVIARIAFGLAFALFSTLASLPVGAVILDHDIDVAQRYCESLMPRLEEHKAKHGEYPREIGSITNLPEPPRLIRGESFYSTSGAEFRFSFVDPS